MASHFERSESKTLYYPEGGASSPVAGASGGGGAEGEHALVEHCGWLLKQGRAVQNWKMRWVMLQAGCLWYFRDDQRKELVLKQQGRSQNATEGRQLSATMNVDLIELL